MESEPEPSPPKVPPPRRTVGAGASLASGAAVGTAALGGLLGVLVARVLGPADTGTYNVISSTFLILLTVGTLGLNVGATYRVGNRTWAADEAFRQLQLAALGVGLVTSGATLGLAALTADSLYDGVPLATLAIVLCALPFALSWTFTSSVALSVDRYETFAFAPLTANALTLAAACVLTPTIGLTGAIVAVASGQTLTGLSLLVWGDRALPRARPGWLSRSAQQLRATASFGIKSYVPQALQFLNYRADLFVLNAVASQSTVGHYAVALVVSELGMLAPRSLSAVIVPRVAALDAEPGTSERDMVIEKSVRHAVLLAPVTWAFLSLAMAAIPIVFGHDFDEAVGPGLVLAPGVAALGIASVLVASVIGAGRPELALYGSLVVTPATLALYLALVPTLEIYGAAGASTASYVASVVVAYVFFRRATGARLRSLLPTRDELVDYRLLFRRAQARLRARRSTISD